MNNRPYGGVVDLKFFCNAGIGNIDKRKPVLYPSAVDMSECAVFFRLVDFLFLRYHKTILYLFLQACSVKKSESGVFFFAFPVPRQLRRFGEKLAALYVDGDSMEPTYFRGDMIICDSLGWDGEGIYAIQKNLSIHDTEPKLYNRPVLKDDIYYALYFADKFGHIIRVKKGRSYQLYLPGTIELANTIEARND